MPAPTHNVASLRQLLAVRFPQATRPASRLCPLTATLDDKLDGGLPQGALTELVCLRPGAGGQLFLTQLLQTLRNRQQRCALIDAADGFDPDSYDGAALGHLIWVRCHHTEEAIRSADVILRDANFGGVIVDLRDRPLRELRTTPATTWYRFQRVVETTDSVVLVVTSRTLVPSAQLRICLDGIYSLSAMEDERDKLIEHLPLDVVRARFRNNSWEAAG